MPNSVNPHKDVILSSAGITATLVLAEPTIFLSGFSRQEQAERPPALVRGSLMLRITKPVKLKAINLTFKGTSRTEWPEGIPSEKSETYEIKEVFSHEWRLFSTQLPNAEKSSGAHTVIALDGHDPEHLAPSITTPHALVNQQEAVAKGYRVFNPAEYVYNFELMLPQKLPETTKCNFGQIKWGFHLSIERHGTFKPRLSGVKDVMLLRTLGPSNLESSEPIVINRDWEDLLHYEIVIAGKAFAIGQSLNVAFALVPMAKVKCHRIRIYITEHTEYFCRNHRIHRVEPSHKFLLLEKKSPDGNRGDLLQNATPGMSGLTEMEFKVEIPETFPSRRDYLRPNANTETIKVYHWIKAVMRLSREDVRHNGEPKCYEVSIDSPITLVDSRTLQANNLPDYQAARDGAEIANALKPYQDFIDPERNGAGGSANASASAAAAAANNNSNGVTMGGVRSARSGSSSASRARAAGSPDRRRLREETDGKAILFTRQPTFAPPPFDADVQPPPLLPPDYAVDENEQSYQTRYAQYLRTKDMLVVPGAPRDETPFSTGSDQTERLTTLTPEPASSESPSGSPSGSVSGSASGSLHESSSGSPATSQPVPVVASALALMQAAVAQGDAIQSVADAAAFERLSGDSSSDSSASSISRHSDPEDPKDEPEAKPSWGDLAKQADRNERERERLNKERTSKNRQLQEGARRAANQVPVFSEIIWTEDTPAAAVAGDDDMVDPAAHLAKFSMVGMADSAPPVPPQPRNTSAYESASDSAKAAAAAAAVADRCANVSPSDNESPRSDASSSSSPRGDRDRERERQRDLSSSPLTQFTGSPTSPTSPDRGSPRYALSPSSSPFDLQTKGMSQAAAYAQAGQYQMQKITRFPSNERYSDRYAPDRGSARAIPKRGSLSGKQKAPASFGSGSYGANHMQRLRSAGGAAAPSSPLASSSMLMSRRSSAQGGAGPAPLRVSLKNTTASPLVSPWDQEANSAGPSSGNFSFGSGVSAGLPAAAMAQGSGGSGGNASSSGGASTPGGPNERRDSASSIASYGPRYFRQSSVVSVDISRQGGGEFGGRETRRPSHVGEIQELRDWHPLSRTNSEASFAVSIAEYESLPADGRPQTPLLGGDESEMDLGTEWEHDFEDFDMQSDRGSIVSAFYTVMTP